MVQSLVDQYSWLPLHHEDKETLREKIIKKMKSGGGLKKKPGTKYFPGFRKIHYQEIEQTWNTSKFSPDCELCSKRNKN